MFDDSIVFETPGDLSGIVRPDNIRQSHFSRNPKITQFLRAYKYVKEFGEGIDRICNELETKGCAIHHSTLRIHSEGYIEGGMDHGKGV